MTVVTRFAPSPTGFLHIGSARTALFNHLFAKRHKGKFLLRIEDTDKQRSTAQAVNALLSGLRWLGINWDNFSESESEVYQSKNIKRHQEVAFELLRQGKAYKCFVSQEEIRAQKEKAISEGESYLFTSPWREMPESEHPSDQPYVIRFKTPLSGTTVIDDLIHGPVRFENDTIEDMVLLRSDMEPLYNLCVFIDDHDMGVTHIIRGDDHFTNAARQKLLYEAMGWSVPKMAHIPLIHGSDGAKLSKRHGATNVEDYKAMGYLPEALVNYILRLGWSYEGDEIIAIDEAAKIFDIDRIGKSCSRIDFDKMKNINAQYIRNADEEYLTGLVIEVLAQENLTISSEAENYILKGMSQLKLRASLINELAQMAKIFLLEYPVNYTAEASEVLSRTNQDLILKAIDLIKNIPQLDSNTLQVTFKELAATEQLKLGELMQPIRCLLTGSTASPSVFEIIAIIGKENTLNRLKSLIT